MMQHGNGRNEILPATATAATNVTYFPTVWPQKNGLKTSFSKENSEQSPQVSGQGPTFSITRGSFLATAGSVVSGIDSSGGNDDNDASVVVAASPRGRL